MKLYRLFAIALVLSLLAASFAPVPKQVQAQTGVTPDGQTPDAVPVLACSGNGISGDLADSRGIQFTVDKMFNAVEARFDGSVAGTYLFTAELRRSSGFLTKPIASDSATVVLPGTISTTPYKTVRFNFGNTPVTGSETFTVKFIPLRIPANSSLYFETYGIGNKPCANVMETDDNASATPVERGDPAGFRVLSQDFASTFAATPPRIDGKVDYNEWNLANQTQYDWGFISVQNDASRLYVLLDVLGDTVDDSSTAPDADTFYLTFDTNRNGVIDANTDLNYSLWPGTNNIRYQKYLSGSTWTGLESSTYSSRGEGFGCFFGDNTFRLTSLFPLKFTCLQHRVWEFAIDLAEIGSSAPGSARMGVRVISPTPVIDVKIPTNFTNDFTNLINIALASPPYLFLAPAAGANVGFETNPIEVTQAVQHRDNSLPLVANKTTVARVYTRTTGTVFPQTVRTYLYARNSGGIDLPGSPMVVMQTAPVTITRTTLNNTANFMLPASWDQGSVIFSAKAVDFNGHTAATSDTPLSFTLKSVPTYWVLPVNIGTAASPVVPSQATIDSQISYLKAIYPVPDVHFVQKPWTVIGTTTVDDTITKLNSYYNATLISWFISYLLHGSVPFAMPSQIYGVTPTGGGISDPTWVGGAGRVARGFLGTSLEGTMAHEINHNLDRSASGTWGRHVNPSGSGCGAAGPDPSWPYTNPNIHEVGFDTRLPWSPSGTTKSVIPSTTPDIMSYCQSGYSSPTKWISDYRWQALFNNFPSPLLLAADDPQAMATAIVPVFYISGSISRNPESGILQPVLTQPGQPSTINKGDYSIDLLDGKGVLISSTPFLAEFLDDPEEPVNTAYFNFQISAVAGVGKVVLKHGTTVLDQIDVSSGAPTVSFVTPKGGENWSGVQTVQWTASDPDKDPLTFTLLYSPDSGTNWYPVAGDLKTTSVAVDLASLPGGSSTGIFRVIATDGFNNGQADSAAFTIGNNPPVVNITAPESSSAIPTDAVITLSGSATDPEGEYLPDDAFVWTEGDTVIGNGREATATMPSGLHTVTLSVVDSLGNTGKTTVTFFVGERIYMPRITH